MNLREQFLKSVEEDSPQTFLHFMEQHNSKNESFDVEELLQTLPKKDHERLWTGLRDMTHRLLLTNPVGSQQNADSENEEPLEWSVLLSVLEGVTVVALCALATPEKSAHTPSALLEAAVILHGLLMSLPEGAETLQNNIAQLCELWFLNELEGKEELVTQAFPYLIIRSLSRGIVSDVKRVWSLRQSLLLMDFEDNSSESLKQLLHQCMIHPMYLKLEEGRRFLSYSFGLNPELSKEFHETIKNQIPYCAVNVLSLYGEVYFRAWRVASGAYLKVLEENCVQDLMFSAVHAQRTGTQSMASRLRKVLEYFHQQKKQRGVDEALLRLYQPIIWRAFKVANPMVRANAAALLTDTFPLQNPDAGNEEIDALLQKQFDIMKDLLEDSCPTVRATAIHGVCRITGIFWELIPAHIIKMFLTTLITELAFDVSSCAVRVAVFQGLKFLLDNRLSHPLLKPLLSNLQDLVHDQSEKVRVAFLDVLLLVKGLKAIKFWNIVPLEQLLSQLEVEQSATVIRRLVKLLVNSFHPTTKGVDIQVTRCSALWQSNPVAARKFYQYVHLHTTVSATGKFMTFLCNCLVKLAQSGNDESNMSVETDSQAEDKENAEGIESLDTSNDSALAEMAETIAICWGGIKDQLDKSANEATKTKLVEKFTRALPKLFGAFKHPRIQAACLVIAGFLPSSSLPAFSAKCLSSLHTLPAGTVNTEYGPLLNCLCAWDRVSDVLELVNEWITAGLSAPTKDTRKGEKTRQKRKSVTFQLPSENKHVLALNFLSWIMGEPTCRSAVQESFEKLRQIADNLRLIMATIESRLTPLSESVPEPLSQTDEEFFQKAFQAYCLSEIHLHHMEKNEDYGGAIAAMENILVWAERVLLPVINAESNLPDVSPRAAESTKRVYEEGQITCLAVSLIETVLTCASEMVMLGIAEEKFYNHVAVFTTSLTKIDCNAVKFLPQLSKLLYQVVHSMLLRDESGNVNVQGGPVSIVLTNVLEILTSCDTAQSDVLPQALLAFRPALAEVLLLTEIGRRSIGANTSLMAPLVTAALTNTAQQSSAAEDDVSHLPRVASFIVKMVTSSQALLRSFMNEVKRRVLSGALDENIDTQAAAVALLDTLQGTADTNLIKTCALHINERLKTSVEINTSEQREDIQSARLLVQSLLSKLQGEPTCRSAVQESFEKLRQIADNLRLIMATIESRLTPLSESVPEPLSQTDEEFFQKAFQAYCLSEIHLHHMEKNEDYGGAIAAMENILVWAERVLLPVINAESNLPDVSPRAAESTKRVYEEGQITCLAVSLIETVLTCASEMVMLGIAEEKFYNHVAVFTTSLTKIDCNAVKFLPQLSKLLYQVVHSMLLRDESGNVNVQGGPVSIVLTNVLEILTSCDTAQSDVLPQALLAFRPALAEVLLLTEIGRRSIGANTSLMAPLVTAALTNTAQQSSAAEDDVSHLPRVASFIVKMVTSSQALLRSFMNEVKRRVLSGALDENIDTQAAAVALLDTLQGTADTNLIKTCALHINERLKTSVEINTSEQREDIQSARLLVQSLLSKLQVVS